MHPCANLSDRGCPLRSGPTAGGGSSGDARMNHRPATPAAQRNSAEYELARPFAYKLFYTDGASIWARENEDNAHAIELVGKYSDHYVWCEAIETFAESIRFEGSPPHATSWELSPWVEIDPTIRFGKPIVRGTRVAIHTIAANLETGSPTEVADWYGLRVEQVEGVRDYLAVH